MFSFFKRIYWYVWRNIFVSSNSKCALQTQNVRKCRIKVSSNSTLIVASAAKILNSEITLYDGAYLSIGKGVVLCNIKIELHSSTLEICDNSVIENSNILGWNKSCILLDENHKIQGVEIRIDYSKFSSGRGANLSDWILHMSEKSFLSIGESVFIEKGNNWSGPEWTIEQASEVHISGYNRLRNRMWIRFGAKLLIGVYNCINEGSEIRVDEAVTIGDFNMISYHCRIWDTDTHTFYPGEERRKMTTEMFPVIGAEMNKPCTKPVIIGNDCLIGEGALLLKGTKLGNGVKVGTGTIVSNITIGNNHSVVGGKCRVV